MTGSDVSPHKSARLMLAAVCVLAFVGGPASDEMIVPDDQDFRGQHEIRGVKKLGVGTDTLDRELDVAVTPQRDDLPCREQTTT